MEAPSLEERAITYIEVTRQHFVTYHHHKENMAYVAAALYLTGVSALIVQKDMEWVTIFPVCLSFFLVILISLLGMFFVGWQLKKRTLAHHIVLACDHLRARWVESYPQSLPTSPTEYKDVIMPTFLREEILKVFSNRGTMIPTTITLILMGIWLSALLIRICLTIKI